MVRLFVGIACIAVGATATWAQAPGQAFNQGAAPQTQPGQVGPGGPGGPGMMMGPPPNAMFNVIDADGDGVITKAELRKAVNALKRLDADGDGNITLAEVSPLGGPMGDPAQFKFMVDRMMQSDANGDGLLQAEELQGPMAQRLLQEGDQNQDGALYRDEITLAMQNMRNRFPGGPGNWNAAQPGQAGGQFGGNFDPQEMTGRMMQYDRNGDGKLSPAEVPQDARRYLNNADQDGDGLLSPAEVQAVNERFGERARARGFRGRAAQDAVDRRGTNRQQPGTP